VELVVLDVAMDREMVVLVEDLTVNHCFLLEEEEDLSPLQDLVEMVAEDLDHPEVEQMEEEDPVSQKTYQEVLLEFLEYTTAEIVPLTQEMLVAAAAAEDIMVVVAAAVTAVDSEVVVVLDTSIQHTALQELYIKVVELLQEIHQIHKEVVQEILELVVE
jgi:hypothetical protein